MARLSQVSLQTEVSNWWKLHELSKYYYSLSILKKGTPWVHVSTAVNKAGWIVGRWVKNLPA